MKATIIAHNGDRFAMDFKVIDMPRIERKKLLVASKEGPIYISHSHSWTYIRIISENEGTVEAGEDYAKLIDASPFYMEWNLPISDEYPISRQVSIEDAWIVESGDEFVPSLFYRQASIR